MIIKAYYAGGRIDVFDTDRMTDGIPQPGNLLTNYTLDLADVGEESLWLRSYYYEAADAYKDEIGPAGLPMARRRDGWSFLIADEEDLKALNRLTVDGEVVLIKVVDDLVDALGLFLASYVLDEIAPRIVDSYRLDIVFGGSKSGLRSSGLSENSLALLSSLNRSDSAGDSE